MGRMSDLDILMQDRRRKYRGLGRWAYACYLMHLYGQPESKVYLVEPPAVLVSEAYA